MNRRQFLQMSMAGCMMAMINAAVGNAGKKKPPIPYTFADEFNTLDTARWNLFSGTWGAMDYALFRSQNVSVSGGNLVLTARRELVDGHPWTSGFITTEWKWLQQYGVFEIRAKLPAGQGMAPAFWLLPADHWYVPVPSKAEIDVFEVLGKDPTTVYMSVHGETSKVVNVITGVDTTQWHIYKLVWTASSLTYFIDGTQRARTTLYVPQKPMFLLISLDVGGAWGGDPDTTTPSPASMMVDYVRVSR